MSKTIVITGGTSGIGLACAEYLLKHDYKVIITGTKEETLKKALNKLDENAFGFVSDTSSLPAIDELVGQVKNRFGKIDGLFVNAGIYKPMPLETTSEEVFDQTMDINFKGAFFTIQKFIPLLNNPSSIVLTTSVVIQKAFENSSVYTASKSALESLSQVLNLELASRGIRVNVVSPGVTKTEIQGKSGMSQEQIDGMFEYVANTTPLGRILEPTDFGPIVEFLLSDKSIAFRNEKILVDGGIAL